MCSVGKVFLENSQNSQENTCARVSFLTKLQQLALALAGLSFIEKETPAQVFSCEFCKISMNSFLYRTPAAASACRISKIQKRCFS